jgi:hypothetical protein
VSIRYVSLFFCSAAFAQFGGTATVRGELQIEGVASDDYQVEMADCSGGGHATRGWITSGNRFEFDDVAPGCKILRVVTGDQKSVVHEMQIFVEGSGTPITIRVPKQDREPSAPGSISVERLRHPIPEKAVRMMADANRLWKEGRVEKAAAKLRPAALRYPDFWEIHVNLGVIEMKLDHFDLAADEFLKARQLQPRSAVAAIDAAFALMRLHRLDEAERAAKDAVSLDPQNHVARLLLARVQSTPTN